MTMNLISAGPCTLDKNFTSYGRTVPRMATRDFYTTADIDGAKTFVRTSTLTNKPNLHEISVSWVLQPQNVVVTYLERSPLRKL